MTARSGALDPLFGTTWIHFFEEDTAEGAVYRPETEPVSLSRRPRQRLELSPDGSARVFVAGADDRLVAEPGTWRHEGDTVVVHVGHANTELWIVERSASRLVVRPRPGAAR